jgi:hypothetical protein
MISRLKATTNMNIKIENVQVRSARCACSASDPEQTAIRPRTVAP